MAEQNHPNTNVSELQRAILQQIVNTVQHYRILLAGRINGLEEYQELLDDVEDIAMELIRVGELPASEEGRELVHILFNELFHMMRVFIDLLT